MVLQLFYEKPLISFPRLGLRQIPLLLVIVFVELGRFDETIGASVARTLIL